MSPEPPDERPQVALAPSPYRELASLAEDSRFSAKSAIAPINTLRGVEQMIERFNRGALAMLDAKEVAWIANTMRGERTKAATALAKMDRVVKAVLTTSAGGALMGFLAAALRHPWGWVLAIALTPLAAVVWRAMDIQLDLRRLIANYDDVIARSERAIDAGHPGTVTHELKDLGQRIAASEGKIDVVSRALDTDRKSKP